MKIKQKKLLSAIPDQAITIFALRVDKILIRTIVASQEKVSRRECELTSTTGQLENLL